MKKIAILGSTGSIGTQALQVVRKHPDKYQIEGLCANENKDLLLKQALEFKPKKIALKSKEKAKELKKELKILGIRNIEVLSSDEGICEIATMDSSEILLTAFVGISGLKPTIEAIKAKKNIALANKETLVTAGEIIMKLKEKYEIEIFPVDSEHSAIFQSIGSNRYKDIKNLLLTASGGPFLGKDKEFLKNAKSIQALKHPNWDMGKKISIDSATLMNKGLEVIEAKWLFGINGDKIKVVVHPESIIHSMVEFKDNSVIAQLSNPNMQIPIQYAFSYPNRFETNVKQLDLFEISKLTFEKPNLENFPCLNLAYEALKEGGSYPVVLNAANEVLVDLYLKNQIGFYDISNWIEKVMISHTKHKNLDLDCISQIDYETRIYLKEKLNLKN